jgi:hypothetical protein
MQRTVRTRERNFNHERGSVAEISRTHFNRCAANVIELTATFMTMMKHSN